MVSGSANGPTSECGCPEIRRQVHQERWAHCCFAGFGRVCLQFSPGFEGFQQLHKFLEGFRRRSGLEEFE